MEPALGALVGITGGLLGVAALYLYLPLTQAPSLRRAVAPACLAIGAVFGAVLAYSDLEPYAVIAVVVVSSLLGALSLIDLATRRLPNLLVLLLLIWGLAQVPLGINTWRSVWMGALFAALMFGLLGLLGRGALGTGDVKLAIAIGAVLGLPFAIHGLVLGVFAGGLGAMLLLATRSATRKDAMAYGPYLAAGAWVSILAMLGVLG